MKEQYKEMINKKLDECADVDLLDLIYQLLVKVGGSNVEIG